MKKLSYLFFVCIFLSSCYSFTTYQTGRTLGENNFDIGITLNGLGLNEVTGIGFGLPLFKPEIQFDYGLSNNFDFGLKYSAPFGLFGNAKFNLIGNDVESKTAIALGIEGGGSLFNFSNDLKNSSFGLYTMKIPVYISFHPSEYFAFGLTPNLVFTGGFSNGNASGSSLLGIAPHIEIGKKIRFILGANLLFPTSHAALISEYGLGLKFGIKN